MKISGFVIMSEPEKLCYPYLESVKSFLPLCDEIIVVFNLLKEDSSALEKLKNLDPKVKVISGLFDYERFGWASQGIMRTNGYYATTGDMVLMWDADGILHENDIEKARQSIEQMYNTNTAYGFWMKHRIFQPNTLIRQCKHSGIFNKSILKNNFNFYGRSGNYAPNWELLSKEQGRGQQLDVYVWGYERCWDTKEVFEHKLKMRRIMEKSIHQVPPLKEYIENYYDEIRNRIKGEKIEANLDNHPKIIQDKIKEISPKHFGYNLFENEM